MTGSGISWSSSGRKLRLVVFDGARPVVPSAWRLPPATALGKAPWWPELWSG
jgi:hypothetical protein